jgi:2-iminobutanoate/2-iminopropanoate deaminase
MSGQKPLVSRFVKVGNLIFLAGTSGGPGDVKTQFKNTFERIKTTLEGAGSSMANVARVTVYMTDISYRAQYLNDLWREYFPDNPPARTCVQAVLGPDVYVEMEAIAKAPD